MKNKLFRNLLISIGISLPMLLLQLYMINGLWLPQLLLILLLTLGIYIGLFVYGLNKKRNAYVALLPLSLLFFFSFFKLIQYQSEKGMTDGDRLVALLEKYKKEHGIYPNELEELEGKYIDHIPKNWSGVIAYPYLYYVSQKNKAFTINDTFGDYGGRIWDSTNGSWDYYGD